MIELNNMKYGEFLQLLEEINELLVWYERKPYGKNNHTIYLSNGEIINYCVNKQNIAHLLGINTEYLKCSNLFSETNSFELLKRLCNDGYGVYKKVNNGLLKYQNFLSKYIDDKLNIFKSNCELDFRTIEFICKYDSKKSYTTGYDKKDIDYLIVSRMKDGKLRLLGLKKDNNNYAAITSQLIDEKEEFGQKVLAIFIESQTLLLPESILVSNSITNYNKTKFSYENEVVQKIQTIQSYSQKYDCIVDVTHMYEYHLRKNIKIKDLNYTIIKTICNAMDKGVTIDLKDLELDADKLPQNLKDLLESYQKFIQESPNSSLKLYALKNMTLNIQQLNEEIESLKVKKNYLEQQVANLEKENKAYSKKLSLIKEIANDTTI